MVPRMMRKSVVSVVAIAAVAGLVGCSDDSSEPAKDAGATFTSIGGQATTLGVKELLAGTGGTAVVGVSTPSNGEVKVGQDGSYSYTPKSGFTGTDSFTYTTTDAAQLFATDIPPLGEVGGVPIVGSAYG